jgi:hypothetical protein
LPLSKSQVRYLKRRAADNSVEVEYLLKIAAAGDASDAALLRSLKAEHGWSDSGFKGRARVGPLGRWADTVCCYLEAGYEELVRLARRSAGHRDFCIAVLESLKTSQSVSALLKIGGRLIERPASDPAQAVKLANALNMLQGYPGAPEIGKSTEARVRRFLHRLLEADLSEVERALCVCALGDFGDAGSVERIARLPEFKYPWASVKKVVSRQIERRLRR